MSSINSVVLVGRIGKTPETKAAQSNGEPVCKFSLAVNRFGKDETDWLNIVCFKRTAEFVQQYMDKGSLVGVEGRIQVRQYDDSDGKRAYWTEIIANNVQGLETKAEADQRRAASGQQAPPQQQQQQQQQANPNAPFGDNDTPSGEPAAVEIDPNNDPFGDQ